MNPDDPQTPPAGDDPQTPPAGDDPQTPPAGEDPQTPPAGEDEDEDQGDLEGDTFPRAYVKRLRERSAGYRARAKTAEERASTLERELFTERVRALDVLADPADLPFDADLLDDPDALREAVDALVASRPHYRRRGVAAGTGSREEDQGGTGVSLLGLMRGSA